MVVYEEEVIYPAKINQQSSKIRKICQMGKIDNGFLNWNLINFKNIKITKEDTSKRRKKEKYQ